MVMVGKDQLFLPPNCEDLNCEILAAIRSLKSAPELKETLQQENCGKLCSMLRRIDGSLNLKQKALLSQVKPNPQQP